MPAANDLVAFRSSYLVGPRTFEKLTKEHAENLHHDRQWKETFLDTKSSSLSHSECMLCKDSDSPKYWKFFCFARDNIMEMTTDEQDISEPLTRIKNFRSKERITKDMLKPFFCIDYQKQEYKFHDFKIVFIRSDYGFAYCTIQKDNVPLDKFVDTLEEAQALAQLLGLENLARYNCKKFL